MCCETFNQTLKMIFFFINDDQTNPVPTVILTILLSLEIYYFSYFHFNFDRLSILSLWSPSEIS